MDWSLEFQVAFNDLKTSLGKCFFLAHPRSFAKTRLICDVSDWSVGAALEQSQSSNQWVPLGFFSQDLESKVRNQSAFERELNVVYLSIRHFK